MITQYYIIYCDKSLCLVDELSQQLGKEKVDLIVTGSQGEDKRISVAVCKTVNVDELSSLLAFITLKTSIVSKLVQ